MREGSREPDPCVKSPSQTARSGVYLSAARLAALLAVGLTAVSFCAARAQSDELTRTMRTRHFAVRYDPVDPYLAEIVAGKAEKELARIARDLGYRPEPDRPFPLLAYPSHYAFTRAGGMETRNTTVGTTRSGDETISVDASDVFVTIQEVLGHEITHAIVFRLLGRRVALLPSWFHEGLAKYESQELPLMDNAIVADAAAEGRLIALANLESGFPQDRAGLAYAESASAVRHLVSKHGRTAPRRLLREVALGGSFDDAMLRVTGMSSEAFAAEWLAFATRRYGGLRLATILTGLVSAFMAILVVFAFIRRRKQKIEAARRWEQEDLDEALRRQAGNDWWR